MRALAPRAENRARVIGVHPEPHSLGLDSLGSHLQPFQCQPPLSILSDQHAANEASLRRFAREAAGSRVVWDAALKELAAVEADAGSSSRFGERLARPPLASPLQSTPQSFNVEPSPSPSIRQLPQPVPAGPSLPTSATTASGRGHGRDYGRSGDMTKFPLNFCQRDFGDLEPGTTLEDEPPSDVLPEEPSIFALSEIADHVKSAQAATKVVQSSLY